MAALPKGVLLIVDDEPLKRVTLQIELVEAGYEALDVPDAASAIQQLKSRPIDVVLTDLRMPEVDGLQLLDQIRTIAPQTHVIMMTAYAAVDSAVEAMKRGAADYIAKPFKIDALLEKLDWLRHSRQWTHKQEDSGGVERISSLIGQSYAARCLFEQLRTVANNEGPVLIQGESGTGKARVAEAIHELSSRAQKTLIRFSCAGSDPHTFDAALFGGQSSDSTGSLSSRTGRLEAANGGTFFLDQVDALPIGPQLKLLRLLEHNEIERNGGAQRIPVDVRLLCATRKNLRQLVDAGQFREDLYFRLNAISLTVPPLRDRREDIPLIVERVLQENNARNKVMPHALEKLMTYHWPGNIRELEHTIKRAISLAAGAAIAPKDIVLEQDRRSAEVIEARKSAPERDPVLGSTAHPCLTETIAGVESSLINAALRRAAGNQAKAAQFLGIPRTTLRDKMAKYGMGSSKRESAQP